MSAVVFFGGKRKAAEAAEADNYTFLFHRRTAQSPTAEHLLTGFANTDPAAWVYENELRTPYKYALYAVLDGTLVGYVVGTTYNRGNGCEVKYLEVSPAHQRKGLCSMMLQKFIERTGTRQEYILKNAGGTFACMCYFKAFSADYDVYAVTNDGRVQPLTTKAECESEDLYDYRGPLAVLNYDMVFQKRS